MKKVIMMKQRSMPVLFLAMLLLPFLAAPTGAATPVPSVTGPVPVTATSVPFMSVSRLVTPTNLAKSKYVEEEYFLSGKANVYDWKEDGSVTILADGPYTNRILVRKPANPAKASGTVVVELLNASSGYDSSSGWASLGDLTISRGDVWIGITIKPFTVVALKRFNQARYASLSWATPRPMPEGCKLTPDYSADTEEGLVWDMLSQLGALLKSKDAKNPLAGYGVKYLYMTGVSQSGMNILTYINAGFHDKATLDTAKPLYDGYLIDTGHGRIKPINQCAPSPPLGTPRAAFRGPAPLIIIAAQSDFNAFDALKNRRPDNDVTGDQFRLYEVTGSTHSQLDRAVFASTQQDITLALGRPAPPAGYVGVEQPPNDFSRNFIVRAAYVNLDQWVRKGIPAPKAERIEVTNPTVPEPGMFPPRFGTAVVDEFGNAKGGVRSPAVDVPTATYMSWCTVADTKAPSGTSAAPTGPTKNWLLGFKVPFTNDQLKALYGTHNKYAKRVWTSVDKLVKDRWLLPADGRKIKLEAAKSNILR
jgi:hypothetical protein